LYPHPPPLPLSIFGGSLATTLTSSSDTEAADVDAMKTTKAFILFCRDNTAHHSGGGTNFQYCPAVEPSNSNDHIQRTDNFQLFQMPLPLKAYARS